MEIHHFLDFRTLWQSHIQLLCSSGKGAVEQQNLLKPRILNLKNSFHLMRVFSQKPFFLEVGFVGELVFTVLLPGMIFRNRETECAQTECTCQNIHLKCEEMIPKTLSQCIATHVQGKCWSVKSDLLIIASCICSTLGATIGNQQPKKGQGFFSFSKHKSMEYVTWVSNMQFNALTTKHWSKEFWFAIRKFPEVLHSNMN